MRRTGLQVSSVRNLKNERVTLFNNIHVYVRIHFTKLRMLGPQMLQDRFH